MEAKRRTPANLSAYDFYLLGREQFYTWTKDAHAKGLELIEKAIALDPNFAPAYVSRAWFNFMKVYLSGAPYASQFAKFENDVRIALALDPTSAEAHAALVRLYAEKGQFEECSAEIDIILSSNPMNMVVLTVAAQQLSTVGRPEEGVAIADRAMRLDPQMGTVRRISLVNAYFMARKYARVLEVSAPIPEEMQDIGVLFPRAVSLAEVGRTEESKRIKSLIISKYGVQVEEVWLNEGYVYARQTERDVQHDAFRKLDFRICATSEELKGYPNLMRYPECAKS